MENGEKLAQLHSFGKLLNLAIKFLLIQIDLHCVFVISNLPSTKLNLFPQKCQTCWKIKLIQKEQYLHCTLTLEKYSTYPLHVYPLTWVPIYLNAHCTANTMKEPNQLIIKTFKETIYNRNLKKIKIQFKLNKRTFFAESR